MMSMMMMMIMAVFVVITCAKSVDDGGVAEEVIADNGAIQVVYDVVDVEAVGGLQTELLQLTRDVVLEQPVGTNREVCVFNLSAQTRQCVCVCLTCLHKQGSMCVFNLSAQTEWCVCLTCRHK